MSHDGTSGLDYRSAFELAPIGLVLSRQRLMIDCNHELLQMFGAQRVLLPLAWSPAALTVPEGQATQA